jgi:hypothetical protein
MSASQSAVRAVVNDAETEKLWFLGTLAVERERAPSGTGLRRANLTFT